MSRIKNKYGLTPSQELFCNLFIYGDEHTSGNASACYKNSYNVRPNTKPESIHRQAHEILNFPQVKLRIEDLQEQLNSIYKADAETQKKRVLNRLWEIADQENSQNVGALRLIAQATDGFFKDNTIKTEQNINIKDSIQELDLLITEISKDDNVIRLFNKDKDEQ